MAAQKIIQIVPRRHKNPEGVGDYARLFAEKLLENHELETHFISGSPLPPNERAEDTWRTDIVSKRTKKDLLSVLNNAAEGANKVPVVLHLSAYGYHHRGAALWLVRAIAEWRRLNPDTPLMTVVHEIRAHGKPWQSSFWLGWVQERVARSCVKISDAIYTPSEAYARQIEGWKLRTFNTPVVNFPVFSTVGELKTNATKRKKQLVIFGGRNQRNEIYTTGNEVIKGMVKSGQVSEIVDIGSPLESPPTSIDGIPITAMGMLSAAKVSAILKSALCGLTSYDASRLGKSTILAAYSAHGIAPICISNKPAMDGLTADENVILTEPTKAKALQQDYSKIGKAAFSWYQTHNLETQSRIIADWAKSA